MLKLIGWIPVLPLAGVAINGLLGRRMSRRAVGLVGCGVVLAALILSAGAVIELSGLPEAARHFETDFGTWMPLPAAGPAGSAVAVPWGFALDPLSAVMILIVTGVGFLIHVYSVGYMEHEEGFARFFVYINLFMSMMLTLVLGSNLLVTFVGWEGVGLCSYLLIGFFYDRPFDARTGLSCADAGRKAFLVNRIGDFAFVIGMLYLVTAFGTLDYRGVADAVAAGASTHGPLLVAVGILLFIGACGKSAQIPLYVWLPDAMAGPTPVSALIHAATMVTAGVYMVTRMSGLYVHAQPAMGVIAAVGAATAIFAATMGITATDIKKVLAYSTVSQLGYMFAAAGVGAWTAAIFHLMTHAFFKALLFLGAGSVIHGQHGEQDITKMGGLRAKMPVTFATFLTATLAIAGIVPLAGFFSKDEILAGAWASGSKIVWGVLALSAGLTAFYMFRLTFLVFYGGYRGDNRTFDHAQESPATMTVPLMILAALSVVGGWIGIPAVLGTTLFGRDVNAFHHWLAPAIAAVPETAAEQGGAGIELALMAVALAIALAGIAGAYVLYRKREGLAASIAGSFRPVDLMWRNLYWVDELYEAAVIRPFYAIARFCAGFDRFVVDGIVNGTAFAADVAGQLLKLLQTGYVRNYALLFLMGVVMILVFLARH
jgi:NADH-quinone oxidoreductase subunit L